MGKRTNAKHSTSLHSAATASRHPVLTSLHSHHSHHTLRTRSRSHPWRPLNYSSCRVFHPRLSAPTFSRNHNHRAPFRNLPPTRIPHTLAASTAATTYHHRAAMSQPLKRKRAEDVETIIKQSRRRLNPFKAEDDAKELFADYSKRHPVSIRLRRISTIQKPRILTRHRA